MNVVEVGWLPMLIGYASLIVPLALILWLRIGIVGDLAVALVRMTLQLLFVGFYLQVVFEWNNPAVNAVWLVVMVGVADVSVARRCDLRLRVLALPLFASLVVGLAVPLLVLLGPVLQRPGILPAQYAIPLGGMILGNCLRGDIIGVKHYFDSLRQGERAFQASLCQGASLSEALRPYYRDACRAALAPTIATMATIGLVSLPGMMTGVILGGVNPMTAIKYQILIMLAIFSGTAITVVLAVLLASRTCFTSYGVLDRSVFRIRD